MTLAPSGLGSFTTFRDPAGVLTLTEEHAIRFVRPEYVSEALKFLGSPLYVTWQERGDLVTTEVTDDLPSDSGLCLRHPRFFFPTYPWEWSPAQWLASAELTLDLCSEGLAGGYVLKDATPLNILFDGPRPVFVDVLSFDRSDPGSPVWLAYGQFVRTFLLPLVAHHWLGWPLSATLLKRDGYEPEDIYAALPRLRRYHPRLLWPVTLPALLEKRASKSSADAAGNEVGKATAIQRKPQVALQVLRHSLATLKRQIRYVTPALSDSQWSQYQSTLGHYSSAEVEEKRRFVQHVLDISRPATVLDIGANTGTYSFLAAETGARVVSLDTDPAAIERLWRAASERKLNVLPLVANIARPTPSVGWDNSESLSLLDRATGKFDLVMMLAVIHHLILTEQIPLDRIASLCFRLARRWLLVEWVPPSDPMYRKLVRGREDLYGALNENDFGQAFHVYFETVEQCRLSNGRTLFLLRRRDP
jgi:SAM-dependent methyltransferase